MVMRYISLFSGIGGFDKGFEDAGMICDSVVEIDKSAQNILRRHFPRAKIYDDVRKVGKQTHGRKSIDLICGGFPCQDVSVAGKRAGLAGERSGLWWEFARIVDELEPQWVAIENVPGLLSSCGCATCGAVRRILRIHTYLRRKRKIHKSCAICHAGGRMLASHKGRDYAKILHWLVQHGYGVVGRILDSQYFGVPQRRRRVFLVASLGDGRAAQVLFESQSLSGNTPPRREAGKDVAYSLRANPSHSGDKGDGGVNTPLVARSLRAQGQLAHREDVDTLIVEQNNVSSTPDMISLRANPAQPVIAFTAKDNGRDASEEISPTLRSMNHDKSHGNGGGQVAIAFQQNMRDEVGYINGDGQIVGALSSQAGMKQQSYVMAHGQANAELVRDGSSSLTRNHEAPILFQNVAPPLDTGYSEKRYSDQQFFAQRGDGFPVTPLGIRRLIPVECERLQGFPDGWTEWGISENGQVIQQADSTRYRQLGNAVTRNVAYWLGKRILESS